MLEVGILRIPRGANPSDNFQSIEATGNNLASLMDIIDIKNISYDKSLSVDNAKKFTDKPMTLGYGKPAY